jgi:geranylgeranyl diphosphate synthase type II
MPAAVTSAQPNAAPPFVLESYLAASRRRIDRALQRALPPASRKPATIHKAMRYSMFAGGAKRLRPVLCLSAAEACGGDGEEALPLACAVECIHTYSLIHDDLPSMDNDDFRRGQPTCHKVFGDGMAVLAGDALLTFAFELVARARSWPRYDTRALLAELALTSGSQRLIAGQVADLEGEGKRVDLRQLRYIHQAKTAALLTTAIRFGGMSANAAAARLASLTDFGRALGLAFQVIDDILDVTQTSEKLGKSAGKDVAAQKATYPALLGLEGARAEARRLTAQARAALKPFGKKAEALRGLADHLLQRDY